LDVDGRPCNGTLIPVWRRGVWLDICERCGYQEIATGLRLEEIKARAFGVPSGNVTKQTALFDFREPCDPAKGARAVECRIGDPPKEDPGRCGKSDGVTCSVHETQCDGKNERCNGNTMYDKVHQKRVEALLITEARDFLNEHYEEILSLEIGEYFPNAVPKAALLYEDYRIKDSDQRLYLQPSTEKKKARKEALFEVSRTGAILRVDKTHGRPGLAYHQGLWKFVLRWYRNFYESEEKSTSGGPTPGTCGTCGHHKGRKTFHESCPRLGELLFKGGTKSAKVLMEETQRDRCPHWFDKKDRCSSMNEVGTCMIHGDCSRKTPEERAAIGCSETEGLPKVKKTRITGKCCENNCAGYSGGIITRRCPFFKKVIDGDLTVEDLLMAKRRDKCSSYEKPAKKQEETP
jgi:hypothetical protein